MDPGQKIEPEHGSLPYVPAFQMTSVLYNIDSSPETLQHLVAMAAGQRLLSSIRIEETPVDQSSLLRVMETVVRDYTKTLPTKDLLYDKAIKQTAYETIITLIDRFDLSVKVPFQRLWEITLFKGLPHSGLPTDKTLDQVTKEHLETVMNVTKNKKVQTYVTNALRTSEKLDAVLKRALNIGESFESLFDDVGLSKKDNLRKSLLLDGEADICASLEAVLSGPLDGDENTLVSTVFRDISRLHDPDLRNKFYNRILVKVVNIMTDLEGRTGAIPVRWMNLFVQFYCYLVSKEMVPLVDPVVQTFLSTHPLDFFTYQLQHMPMLLAPHSNFRQDNFVLEQWQRDCLKAVEQGYNILLSAPTSSGKSLLSTHGINNHSKILYVVPSEALGYQQASILLASLLDQEKRIGATRRNFRLEMKSKRFRWNARAADDIIVGTPAEMCALVQSGEISSAQDYLILDEFHNLQDVTLGPSYRKLLWFAAFHKIPTMCLSATIPNFEEVKTSLEHILHGPLFAVNEYKRFFNQKRWTFRATDKDVKLVEMDPMDNITSESLLSRQFHRIGLYPGQTLSLYQRLPTAPRVDERTPRLVSLDEVEHLEGSLIRHLQDQDATTLMSIVKGKPVAGDSLTLYQLYKALKDMNTNKKPALVFKMEPLACLTLYNNLIHLIQDYNALVYANFNDDQSIVQQYLEEATALEASIEIPKSKSKDKEKEKATSGRDLDPEEVKQQQKERLFRNKFLPKLASFYDAYLKMRFNADGTPLNQAEYDAFNTKYGATLTHKEVQALREEHVRKERLYTSDTIQMRAGYEIHAAAKITTYSTGHIMKDIRKQINSELAYQTAFHGRFTYEAHTFAAFGDVGEVRKAKSLSKLVAGAENDDDEFDSVKESKEKDANSPLYEYTYNIPYTHPVMVGMECGLLFYNSLLNPAFQRVCQTLISKHPLIVVSDRTLAVGVNYPIKTVLLLGGLRGEPVEVLDNALAHQAMGRAGRRGLDSEGHIIYSGVDVPSILTARYAEVKVDDAKEAVLAGQTEAFQTFVRTGERPVEQVSTSVQQTPRANSTIVSEPVAQPVSTLDSDEMRRKLETMTWEELCDLEDGI